MVEKTMPFSFLRQPIEKTENSNQHNRLKSWPANAEEIDKMHSSLPLLGGALSVTIKALGNGIGDPSSNAGRGANDLKKGMNRCFLPRHSAINK